VTPEELEGLSDLIEELHSAICQAVALLNISPECARGVESREAHNILREALIDYANRCSQPQGERQ